MRFEFTSNLFSLMENTLFKLIFGVLSAIVGIFAPIAGLICCAITFVAVDFITGVVASRHRASRLGQVWSFESHRAWDTIRKAVVIVVGIALAWLIDSLILGFAHLRLANLFTGFVCGVEMWSFLENGAEACNYPPFRWLRRFMQKQLSQTIGTQLPINDETATSDTRRTQP